MDRSTIRILLGAAYFVVAGLGLMFTTTYTDHCEIFYYTCFSNMFGMIMMPIELWHELNRKKPSFFVDQMNVSVVVMVVMSALAYGLIISKYSSVEFWSNPTDILLHVIAPAITVLFVLLSENRQVSFKTLKYVFWPSVVYLVILLLRYIIVGDGWRPYKFFHFEQPWMIVLWIIVFAIVFLQLTLMVIWLHYVRYGKKQR